jgi:hypothetical protein
VVRCRTYRQRQWNPRIDLSSAAQSQAQTQ